MRACHIKPQSKTHAAYGQYKIFERHRHRYEVNNLFRQTLEGSGLVFSGINPDLDLVEMIEIPDHPWFIGVQFHPELKSRVLKAHPLFREFVAAAIQS